MDIDFSEIIYLKDPQWQELHADYVQFLLSMTGPTVIDITGKDTSKSRVFLTLMQGDEPSGFIAIHRWLTTKEEELPQTNIRFIICSVEAAAAHPLFSHRYTKGGMDINRCFGKACDSECNTELQKGYCQRANLIETAIREVNPEMVIDLHNSSSPGPTFGVSSMITTDTLSLASFFCQTLILSDLHIGSIMEQDFNCPFITIECGGRKDEQAHEVAFAGINHVSHCENIGYIHQEKSVDVIYRPLRLQLKPETKLSYAAHDEGFRGVTLKENIEFFNYGSAHQDEMLGWVDCQGLENLQLLNKGGENVIDEYFYTRDNQLVCRHNLKLFKATTDVSRAKNDCLFYVVKLTNNDHNH